MELLYSLRRKFRSPIHTKEIEELEHILIKAIGDKFTLRVGGIDVPYKGNGGLLKGLFLENQARLGVSYRSVQSLTDFHQGKDYLERNMGDLSIELMSVQEEQPTNGNQIGDHLGNITAKIEEMNNRHRWVGQRTDWLERRLLEISNVISKHVQESIGNNAKNQTMGAVGSRNKKLRNKLEICE